MEVMVDGVDRYGNGAKAKKDLKFLLKLSKHRQWLGKGPWMGILPRKMSRGAVAECGGEERPNPQVKPPLVGGQ